MNVWTKFNSLYSYVDHMVTQWGVSNSEACLPKGALGMKGGVPRERCEDKTQRKVLKTGSELL